MQERGISTLIHDNNEKNKRKNHFLKESNNGLKKKRNSNSKLKVEVK
jgi:hypothetical protein